MPTDKILLFIITIVNLLYLIGRWTGKIDFSEDKFKDDIRDIWEEIRKIKETQYKFIQWEQEASGKIGIIENNMQWVMKICNKRHPEEN